MIVLLYFLICRITPIQLNFSTSWHAKSRLIIGGTAKLLDGQKFWFGAEFSTIWYWGLQYSRQTWSLSQDLILKVNVGSMLLESSNEDQVWVFACKSEWTQYILWNSSQWISCWCTPLANGTAVHPVKVWNVVRAWFTFGIFYPLITRINRIYFPFDIEGWPYCA